MEKIEIIAEFYCANESSRSFNSFKVLTDQGVKFFFQGNSSAVAGALTEAVLKHNNRTRL